MSFLNYALSLWERMVCSFRDISELISDLIMSKKQVRQQVGKVWKLIKWVPYKLSERNKEAVCKFLINCSWEIKKDCSWTNSDDESWLLLFTNVKQKKVCVNSSKTSKGIPKRHSLQKDYVLCFLRQIGNYALGNFDVNA